MTFPDRSPTQGSKELRADEPLRSDVRIRAGGPVSLGMELKNENCQLAILNRSFSFSQRLLLVMDLRRDVERRLAFAYSAIFCRLALAVGDRLLADFHVDDDVEL